jgi:tetratricopeptide (TPR) repeat protein
VLNAYGVSQRNKVWKTEESLWLDVTHKSPLNGRGLMNYGLTQMAKGNYTIADSCFEKALTTLPYYSTLYINLGVLKGAMNKPQDAENNFNKAITYSPNTFEPYIYYARYLTGNNQFTRAQPLAEKALEINPYSTMVLNILMNIYNGLGMWDRLQQTADKALNILPDDAVAKRYAAAAKNHTPLATTMVAIPAKKDRTANNYINQSVLDYNRGDYAKCIEDCRRALILKPDNADAYSNMGAAYNKLQQWDKGIAACTKALQINPYHKLAAGNLNWAKNNTKK